MNLRLKIPHLWERGVSGDFLSVLGNLPNHPFLKRGLNCLG